MKNLNINTKRKAITLQTYPSEKNTFAKIIMPFFKKSKAAKLGSTPSEVTLVDSSASPSTVKGASHTTKSKHPKQKLLSSEQDKWNTVEARLGENLFTNPIFHLANITV